MLGRIVHRLKRLRGSIVAQRISEGMVVGRDVWIDKTVVFDAAAPWLIEIGDETTIAPEAYLLVHDASTKRHLDRTRIAKVRLGKRVFVGARALIMPGVTVGDGAIVAAGSIVTKDVDPGTVVAGSPATLICTTAEFLAAQEPMLGGDRDLAERGLPPLSDFDADQRLLARRLLGAGGRLYVR